jgi:hypothetical protein
MSGVRILNHGGKVGVFTDPESSLKAAIAMAEKTKEEK